MFFYLGDNCPLQSLVRVRDRLYLDGGWNHSGSIYYKGYSTDCDLAAYLYEIVSEGYKPAGKWCVIHEDTIYHPKLRGFPIYSDGKDQTNLKLDGFDPVIYNTYPPTDNAPNLSLEYVSEKIGDILVENTRNFYKYNNPESMTVIVSAGLDTHTVWAVQEQVTSDYTLSLYVPKPEDVTVLPFMGTRREYESDLIDKVSNDYWGYYHACYYNNINWNNTGYYAEVLTYRDGEAINAIARYHGKTIDTLASETDYLYWFLKRPNIVEKYRDSKVECSNEVQLKKFLWSTIWYDHQMWHLDNNMMFSPFFDIRIPELMNRLSVEDLTTNCVTGQIQRNIIKRFHPELLSLVSDYKNEKDIWGNFKLNFDSVQIDPKTKIIYR